MSVIKIWTRQWWWNKVLVFSSHGFATAMMMGNKNLRNVGVIPIIKDVCICIYIKFRELMASGVGKVPEKWIAGKNSVWFSYFRTKQFTMPKKKPLKLLKRYCYFLIR